MKNRKYQESGADPNFYRKVSKYDLDRMTVDWKNLRKDKRTQYKFNANQVKGHKEETKRVSKANEVIQKYMKINELKE